MATVYSLVAWGGRTGKSVTASNSSGLIFTSTNHGLRDGTGLVFSGTTAPGNVTFGTTYYAKSLTTSTFAIYTEPELTNRVAWSSAGSGVIAKSKKMLDYFTQYSGRWGGSGSERCYDGLVAWNTGRAGALPTDLEVCELGQSFYNKTTTSIDITVPSGASLITAKIDGEWTEAYHYGVIDAGFVFERVSDTSGTLVRSSLFNIELEGFTVKRTSGGTTGGVSIAQVSQCKKLIVWNASGAYGGTGCTGNLHSKFFDCLSFGWTNGFSFSTYTPYGIYNCTSTKNTYGIYTASTSAINGWIYNTISVGNTTNWSAQPTGLYGCANNAGESGNPVWTTSGGSSITMATTDFSDYNNNDFRPASVSSPQVDAGVEYYGIAPTDLADNERPNYNNGGAEVVDVGCLEFDHGYGPHPITASLTLTGLSSGTDVVVREAGTSTILDSVDSTSGSWSYTYGAAHNVDIDVIKPGMVIVTFRNLALTAESSTLPVSQQPDRNYQ